MAGNDDILEEQRCTLCFHLLDRSPKTLNAVADLQVRELMADSVPCRDGEKALGHVVPCTDHVVGTDDREANSKFGRCRGR